MACASHQDELVENVARLTSNDTNLCCHTLCSIQGQNPVPEDPFPLPLYSNCWTQFILRGRFVWENSLLKLLFLAATAFVARSFPCCHPLDSDVMFRRFQLRDVSPWWSMAVDLLTKGVRPRRAFVSFSQGYWNKLAFHACCCFRIGRPKCYRQKPRSIDRRKHHLMLNAIEVRRRKAERKRKRIWQQNV